MYRWIVGLAVTAIVIGLAGAFTEPIRMPAGVLVACGVLWTALGIFVLRRPCGCRLKDSRCARSRQRSKEDEG